MPQSILIGYFCAFQVLRKQVYFFETVRFSVISIFHEGVLKVFLLNRQAISNKNVLLFLTSRLQN